MLTVSLPTFNTPAPLLDRAVQSVLASPQVDRLVIVNDGGVTPPVPSDRRVVLYELPRNRGRYFCDAVVTEAVDGWWSPHDADDWSEPDRWDGYQTFPVRLAAHARHRRDMTTVRQCAEPSARFGDVGHWCAGVYQLDRVRAAGGVLPQFRVGFDTLFLLMVHMTGPVEVTGQVAYHYARRAGSLTSHRTTGHKSQLRATQADHLARLHTAARLEAAAGRNPARPLYESVDPALRDEVRRQAARLQEAL